MNINKLYILIVLFFGMIILFITPPFQQQDEVCHFLRAYSISENYYAPNKTPAGIGCELPSSVINLWKHYKSPLLDLNVKVNPKMIINDIHLPLNESKKIFTILRTSMSYSPVSYMHYVIPLDLLKICNAPPLIMLYVCRFVGLLLYAFLGYLAIKDMPFLKWITFLILTYPIHICLASSVTVDTILVPCSVLLFAKILKYSFDNNIKTLSNKQLWTLILLSTILALTKYNILLMFFILLIPKEKFGKKYLSKICGIGLLVLFITLIWFSVCREMTFQTFSIADWQGQLHFIFTNNVKFVKIFYTTIQTNLIYYYMTSVGVLGNINIHLPTFVYWGYFVVIMLSLIFDTSRPDYHIFNFAKQFLIISVVCLEFFFIFLIMYLTFNPVGADIIKGVNGRYFAVILLPLFVLISQNIKFKIPSRNFVPVMVPVFTIISLVITVIILFNRFYIIV